MQQQTTGNEGQIRLGSEQDQRHSPGWVNASAFTTTQPTSLVQQIHSAWTQFALCPMHCLKVDTCEHSIYIYIRIYLYISI